MFWLLFFFQREGLFDFYAQVAFREFMEAATACQKTVTCMTV